MRNLRLIAPREKLFFCVMILSLPLFAPRAMADMGETWTQATAAAPWPEMECFPTTVFKDQIWVYEHSVVSISPDSVCDYADRIWCSADGTSWSLVTSTPPWKFERGEDQGNGTFQAVAMDDKLWFICNRHMDQNKNGVWTSIDGEMWEKIGEALPFKCDIQQTVVHNGKVWVIGAIDLQDSGQKIWSTTDGATWTIVANTVPWGMAPHRRGLSTVSFNGKLWVLGGAYGNTYLADVWCSSDGTSWTQVTSSPGWSPRAFFATTVWDGRIWINGASSSSASSDINNLWYSRDGINWTKVIGNPIFGSRVGHACVISGDKMFVLGGYYYNHGYYNDVWFTEQPKGIPQIRPIPDQSMEEGYPYTSPRPHLDQGYGVTWSINGAPDGMTIDPGSGIFSWPKPLYNALPYKITLQATNPLGTGEFNLLLTVAVQPAPVISAPQFSAGKSVKISWTAVPNINGYTVQCAETPDFTRLMGSMDFSTTTLSTVYGGDLQDDTTYWYRVRGNKTEGLTSVWSATTSCTQDATAPIGTLAPACSFSPPPAFAARVKFSIEDPGNRPSGVKEMCFRSANRDWTPWQPYDRYGCVFIDQDGPQPVQARVRDRVGNFVELSTTVTVTTANNVLFVDAATSPCGVGTLQKPFKTIQEGIDASTTGTQVIVLPGIYGTARFKGCDMILRSLDPLSPAVVRSTLIKGPGFTFIGFGPLQFPQGISPAVAFSGRESPACQLAGFTITNGAARYGAGICGNRTRATIQHNRIVGNAAISSEYSGFPGGWGSTWDLNVYSYGYGSGLASCDGLIQNNIIANNRLGYSDAGASGIASMVSAQYYGNSITYFPYPTHTYTHNSFAGGGLFDCNGTIQYNTIYGNSTPLSYESADSQIYNNYHRGVLSSCRGIIRNNIIWNNSPNTFDDCTTPSISCIQGWTGDIGESGIITTDPKLADPDHGDFHLLPDSPCIDAGQYVDGLRWDMDGEGRGWYGSGEARGDGSGFDIGADEYRPFSPIDIICPAEGDTLVMNSAFRVIWWSDPHVSGIAISFKLYQGHSFVADLGQSWDCGDEQLNTLRLPAQASAGKNYRLRAYSAWDPTIWTESAPFEILTKPKNAAAPKLWGKY